MYTVRNADLVNILEKVAFVADKHAENGVLVGELTKGDKENEYCLSVPHELIAKIAVRRYLSLLEKELRDKFGPASYVSIKVDSGLNGKNNSLSTAPISSMLPSVDVQAKARPERRGFLKGNISKDFRLDNYIVGECNQLAYHAISQVVKAGHSSYYPIYLYSSSGLGKTHLLQGLCNAIYQKNPSSRIHYLTCENFTNKFIQAIKSGKQDSFRRDLRDLDILVVDDVHFLSTRKASQEEFVHTFNSLQNSSRTLVVSSDAPPKDQPQIIQQLKERFGGGLVLQLDMPDRKVRREILLAKLMKDVPSAAFSDKWMKIVDYVSQMEFPNIRGYEGALHKIFFTISKKFPSGEFSLDDARNVMINGSRKWTVEECFKRVSTYFSIPEEDIKGKSRTRKVTKPRAFVIRLLRSKMKLSYNEIGRLLSGRAHPSILEMERKTAKLVEDNEMWRKEWNEILEM